MCEAATHQLRAELKCGKKQTKVLPEEAKWEYDSQSSHHFYTLISPEYYSHAKSFQFL